MSYDIRIGVKIEGYDGYAVIGQPELDSPTYNLGRMFRACTGWDYEQGKYYRCNETIPLIEKGIMELSINRSEYIKYQPANGWGTIDDAKSTLESIRECIYDIAEEIPIEHLWIRW